MREITEEKRSVQGGSARRALLAEYELLRKIYRVHVDDLKDLAEKTQFLRRRVLAR